MPAPTTDAITARLADARDGRQGAVDALLPQVYERLRAMAHRQLAGEGQHTLCTTALVHEAYLSLVHQDESGAWKDRAHFYAYAAKAMRHILIDYARRRGAAKRGAGQRVALDWSRHDLAADDIAEGMLALDSALDELARIDPRLTEVVELRFFAGLSVEEAAATLGLTERTVVRDWRRARAILHTALAAA